MDFDDEVRAHIDLLTERYVRQGMTLDEAAKTARRQFGNTTLLREEHRAMQTFPALESLWRDIRFGARQLRSNPGFTMVAVLSLGLGIGANTAIFQLLDAVRLQSLPVARPHELVEITVKGGYPRLGVISGRYAQLTRPIFNELKTSQQAFSGVFAWATGGFRAGDGNDARRVQGLFVSGDFFPVLGVQPWRGRLFVPDDEATACPVSRAVVSHSYWLRELGGRDPLAGIKLRVNGELQEVIGVTPPGFFGIAVGESFDIALPLCRPRQLRREMFDIAVMGRLRPGWTIERATGQLNSISPGIFEATMPSGYDTNLNEKFKALRLAAYPAANGVSALRQDYDASLWLLLSITGLVLLIACGNLANLMLARAGARAREMAVRASLGASRARLLAQLAAESALLSVAGGVLGLAIAGSLSRLLVSSISTATVPIQLQLQTNWRVFVFAGLSATLTTLIFGTLPALRATRTATALRGSTARNFLAQRLALVAQISVSLVLLVGALLFTRSFFNLTTINPGVRRSGIEVAYLQYNQPRLPRERWLDFQQTLLEEIRAIPEIQSAATTSNVPLVGDMWSHEIQTGSEKGSAMFTWVSTDYLRTMNFGLVNGRDIAATDTGTSSRVALVNQRFVRQFLDADNPIGCTVRTGAEPGFPSTVYEIVGVVADTKYESIRTETPPMVFAPAPQFPAPGPFGAFIVHSKTTPASAVAAIKTAIARSHPEIRADFVDLEQRINETLQRDRVMAMLSGFFGALAALLTMIGLYGVTSYVMAQRRSEIGIRVALGARSAQLIGMVLRETGVLVAVGIAGGVALSLLAARMVSTLLFGTTPNDPAILAAACVLLAVVALGASFLPARRAARQDPMLALRQQ